MGKAVRPIAKPFIPWVGGKEKLAPYVRQVLPPKPKVYVEPFGGSGAILLGLPASKTRIDVYNDFNADLVNLFVCVRDSPITLMNELGYLPIHCRAEFEFVKAMPEIVVCRVDDAVKVYYDRESTLAVIDTIEVKITDRAKAFKETEVIFYDVSGLREAQKQLNAIVDDNQIAFTAPAHLYALVGETSVKAEFVNNSKSDSYTVEIRKNSDNALLTDVFELAAGKSVSTLELLEAPMFGDVDCTVTVTACRDGKEIGTLHTELTLHAAYLWPEEVR